MATDAPRATSLEEGAASPPGDTASAHPIPSLVTSPPPPPTALSRPLSHASKGRLSQYSTGSVPSRSRPASHVFPMFPSSLPYALVRDFAYPVVHPMHYGPPPEPSAPPSGWTTPISEHRRLSDLPTSWDQKMPWDSWSSDGFNRGHDVPPISFGDGPPYSEDEDLQSPVVATRHRKHKSTSAAALSSSGGLLEPNHYDRELGYYVGEGGNGGERYYVGHGGEANGPGGEVITYHPGDSRQRHSYYYGNQPPELGSEVYVPSDASSQPSSPGHGDGDESRYSRDYQFTITSPDEEFHGKAVALFDFARENENELPLVEGQIIWVSYRHGQGWLVAEDPKTRENGLVPEEYVRLLRDIEGGMNSLTGQAGDESGGSPKDAETPTQPDHAAQPGQGFSSPGNGANGYHQPVVSMFSTSSKDLNPYPKGQLGIQDGQTPPQVVHYHGQRGGSGSQVNTPTLSQPMGSSLKGGSEDVDDAEDSTKTGTTEGKLDSAPTTAKDR